MPIISAPHEYHEEDLYVDLAGVLGTRLYLKIEGLNFAGSIKLKTARSLVEAAESSGVLRPGGVIVESSSGNLGVALSIIAASKGYRFLCVTDPRCNESTRRLMGALGADVHTVCDPATDGGYLGARLRYVAELCALDSRYVWLNQYTSPANADAHYRWTAPAISGRFADLDVLFIGAGTTGTLMGCARYFKEHRPGVTVVAVDTVGSVSFGGPALPRMIPGLGAGVRPPLLDISCVDDVVHVEEADTVKTCHRLARGGFLLGGSTGTVISGAARWLAQAGDRPDRVAVAIAPDLGERYLDSVYRPDWVEKTYGPDVLTTNAEENPLISMSVV